MPAKRPYSSEGHLALPARVEPEGGEESGPTRLAVTDDALAPFGIRRGDRVLLASRTVAEHGDVVAVADDRGVVRLWKAYPERTSLGLVRGEVRRVVSADTRMNGVVVAVLRPLPRGTGPGSDVSR